MESRIIAGLVIGDMNAIDRTEHEFHKASDVDLKYVWEYTPTPPAPVLKPFKEDFSYGRAILVGIHRATSRTANEDETTWTNLTQSSSTRPRYLREDRGT